MCVCVLMLLCMFALPLMHGVGPHVCLLTLLSDAGLVYLLFLRCCSYISALTAVWCVYASVCMHRCSLVHVVPGLKHSLTRSLSHSLTHSPRSLTHSLTSLTHSLTHSLTLLTHSLTLSGCVFIVAGSNVQPCCCC